MADPQIKPILEIATGDAESRRPPVSINGTIYYMKIPDEFGLVDQGHLRSLYDAAFALKSIDEDQVTIEQRQLMSSTLREFTRTVVIGLPPEELAKMEDRHNFALMMAFGKAVGLEEQEPAATKPQAKTKGPTGTKSSRRSNTSMAATRANG